MTQIGKGITATRSNNTIIVEGEGYLDGAVCIAKMADIQEPYNILIKGNVTVLPNNSITFNGNEQLQNLTIEGTVFLSGIRSIRGMFRSCKNLKSVSGLANLRTFGVRDFGLMFAECENLVEVDAADLNMQTATNLDAMFQDCESLESLDLRKWDVRKVKTLSCFVSGCKKLNYLDLTGWQCSQCVDISCLCGECYNLQRISLYECDLSSVDDMSAMFCMCGKLTTINFSSTHGMKPSNMEMAFSDCTSLKTLNLSSINFDNVITATNMFDNTDNITNMKLDRVSNSIIKAQLVKFGIKESVDPLVEYADALGITTQEAIFKLADSIPGLYENLSVEEKAYKVLEILNNKAGEIDD